MIMMVIIVFAMITIIVFAMMMVIVMIMIMIVVVLMRAMTDCFTARPTGKRNPQIKEIRIKNVERTSYDQHAPCKANLFATKSPDITKETMMT